MSIYLVKADRLHFSAKQLGAITHLPGCGDLGGILEGVAWVRDNDDDIIILACERMNVNNAKLNVRYNGGDDNDRT